MNADVSDDATGAILVPLPRHLVPAAARRDVSQANAVPPRAVGQQPLSQRNQLWVHTQLQDRRHAAAGLGLEFLQTIEVPRVDDERLLANDVGANAEGKSNVRVMQVVW